MKRSIAAFSILAALTVAVIGARHELRPEPPHGEQSPGPVATKVPGDDAALERAIELARQRQARVDGLTGRLSTGVE